MKKIIFLLSLILILTLQSCVVVPYTYNRPTYGYYRPMYRPTYRPMPHYGGYGGYRSNYGGGGYGGGYRGGYAGHRH